MKTLARSNGMVRSELEPRRSRRRVVAEAVSPRPYWPAPHAQPRVCECCHEPGACAWPDGLQLHLSCRPSRLSRGAPQTNPRQRVNGFANHMSLARGKHCA